MQEKIVASRIMYKLYLIAFTVFILSFTVVFFVAFENGAFEATIALAIFNGSSFVLFFFFIRRTVWLVAEGDLVHLGNLFFKKEINIQDITSYNSSFFNPNFYSIKIKSGKYYFVSYLDRNSIKELLSPKPNS
ncbi:MAG: hypothetical protein AAF600_17370 [Bacteroidota bacterium]